MPAHTYIFPIQNHRRQDFPDRPFDQTLPNESVGPTTGIQRPQGIFDEDVFVAVHFNFRYFSNEALAFVEEFTVLLNDGGSRDGRFGGCCHGECCLL